jgi:hypothetical protein
MTTYLTQTVDQLYEGVASARICSRCKSNRPRRPQTWSSPLRKVVLFQIVPGGQFHMALPKEGASLCKSATRFTEE